MPKRFSFSEIAQDAAMGATDIAGEIVQAARGVYCTFAQNSPFSVIYNNPLTSPIITRALTSLCGEPPPDPPPRQFDGGQCSALYTVSYEYKATAAANMTSGGQVVYGPVYRIEAVPVTPTNIELRIIASTGLSNPTEKKYNIKFAAASQNPFPYYAITNVVRTDGEPDTCGNLPDPWYPETEPPPPNTISNVEYNYTNNYGDTNTYNVTINPDSDGHIKFPPVINVNGVAVGIDVGGVSIGEVNIGTDSGGGGSDDINIPPPRVAPTSQLPGVESTPKTVTEEGLEEEVENLLGIFVDISSIPSNAKIVSGGGTPPLIYAGWVQFKRDGNYYPKQYIDFYNSYYPAPSGNTGYSVCLKLGYNGAVRELLGE